MLNSVNIAGRLTADPAPKKTPNGVDVTTFSVAVERSYTKKDAPRETDFIDCVAWRNTASFISHYFHKGDFILITGHLQTRTYEVGESKRKAVEVNVDNAYFGPKTSGAQASAQTSSPAQVPSYSAGTQEDFSSVTDDEDLPF